jgi:hypothetical protein
LLGSDNGAIAVADAPPEVDLTQEAEFFLKRQKYIVIHHAMGEVVALIELISPENKRTVKSVDRFCTKVVSAIDQGLHVLVLDILPPRKHDPQGIHNLIWDHFAGTPYELPVGRTLTLVSYEASTPTHAYVQPLAVGAPLPKMPVFIKEETYVRVPLASTYDEAWQGTPRPWQEMLTG